MIPGELAIREAFESARAAGRAALMPYLMAGFPDRESGLAVAAAYADSGADLVELGVPYSDPLADGPVIRTAAARALAKGATLQTALETCETIADRLPVVLMVYMNMVLARGGTAEFAKLARAAGAAGVIVPDLPSGEDERIGETFAAEGLAMVPLMAPTTSPQRRAQIAAAARGFIYLVSTVGTTGERAELPSELAALIATTKADAGDTPVAVGFGIGTPAQVAEVGRVADGVIIGSRLVRAADEGGSPTRAGEAVAEFLAEACIAGQSRLTT